jgi:hypothetical protein
MTMSRQVQCVNKRDRPNPHERILNIGGVDAGARWKRSQIDAIADVERDASSYYVVDRRANQTVWVIVRVSQYGNKYLTTQADGDSQNNLLSLEECA